MHHGPIPGAGHLARVRRIEQSLQLVARELADKGLIGLLHRDRMDPPRLIEAGRRPVFQQAEEGVDCRDPGVACSRRVPAFALQVG
jgi:hypothetical protein